MRCPLQLPPVGHARHCHLVVLSKSVLFKYSMSSIQSLGIFHDGFSQAALSEAPVVVKEVSGGHGVHSFAPLASCFNIFFKHKMNRVTN